MRIALGLDPRLQALQALELLRRRRVVGQRRRRRAGARAVDEAEAVVEADVLDQRHRPLEVVLGLAGKADDEVARDGDAGPHGAQLADRALELERGVAALHRRQDAVAAVLHRQVHVVDELGDAPVDVDQALREFLRMAGGVADALDARDLGDDSSSVAKSASSAVPPMAPR